MRTDWNEGAGYGRVFFALQGVVDRARTAATGSGIYLCIIMVPWRAERIAFAMRLAYIRILSSEAAFR